MTYHEGEMFVWCGGDQSTQPCGDVFIQTHLPVTETQTVLNQYYYSGTL